MSRSDEDEFVAFLRSMPETAILPASSASTGFAPIDTLAEPSQDESTRNFWLHNRIANLPLVTEFDEEKGLYFINGFQSPVIQFLRSYSISNILLPGRLEADMAHFDDDRGDLVPKPLEFRYWFDSIDQWIRANYKHLTLLTYLGPGAEKFQGEGGLIR
jgi:hypothetical protein